jgi:inorganic pyrophosphatase
MRADKGVQVLNHVPKSDVLRDTAEVVILRPKGTYNDYVFDERLRMVRLKRVVHLADSMAEVGEVRGAWGADDNPFQALIFTALPTLPGCIVRGHVEGALEGRTAEGARHALVLSAVGHRDALSQQMLASQVLGTAVSLLGWRPSTQVGWLDKDAALALLWEGRQRLLADRARQRPARHGAAWKAKPGERPRDGSIYTEPHTWAERMVGSLPFRFQRYVEDELLDEERILFFVERPPFRPPGARWGLLRRQRLSEGLLIITDRQVLFMEDALPPDITMVDWGYIARTTAVERIQGAELRAEPDRAVLHVRVQAESGSEHLSVPFPPECKDPLAEVELLLRSFASPEGNAVRRLYAEGDGAKDMEVVEASSRVGNWVRVEGSEVVVHGPRGEARLNAACISTVEFTNSLVGCRLRFFSPQERQLTVSSVPFEYPEADLFLAVYRRVRWLLARPLVPELAVQRP